MKKIVLFILSVMVMFSVSGCSDFGFNPTGHWLFVSDDLYENDIQIDSATPENTPFLSNIAIIFEKSGTGYFSADGLKTIFFRYSYDGHTVTVTFENDNNMPETSVQYQVSNDGKTLIRTDLSQEKDEDGNIITYREEFVYSRV